MRENTTRIFSAEPVLYNHSDTKIVPRPGRVFPWRIGFMVPHETRERPGRCPGLKFSLLPVFQRKRPRHEIDVCAPGFSDQLVNCLVRYTIYELCTAIVLVVPDTLGCNLS